MQSTPHSLLQRVRRHDPAAWERLCVLYGPILYGWCRLGGLQDCDAADVVQEVFRILFQRLDQFQRDHPGARFRHWLRAIATNQIRLHFRQTSRLPATGLDPMIAGSEVMPDSDDPDAETDRLTLVRRTLELIRGDFTEQTWELFTRTVLQGQSSQEVVDDLGVTSNAIRQARFRVLRRLNQELSGLL